MRKIFNYERGAVNGYVIGIVLLVIVITGGVLLLKGNHKVDVQPDVFQDTKTQTDQKKTDDTKKDETKTDTKPAPNPTPPITTLPSDTSTQPSSTEKIAATGPEDILASVFGLVFIAGAMYAAWNYRLSRTALKKSLLTVKD